MKRKSFLSALSFILIGMLALSALCLVSCSKDDDDDEEAAITLVDGSWTAPEIYVAQKVTTSFKAVNPEEKKISVESSDATVIEISDVSQEDANGISTVTFSMSCYKAGSCRLIVKADGKVCFELGGN